MYADILEIFCLNKLLCRDITVYQVISQKDLSFFLIICFPLAVILLPAIVLKIPPALICHKSKWGLMNLENLGVIEQILPRGENFSQRWKYFWETARIQVMGTYSTALEF